MRDLLDKVIGLLSRYRPKNVSRFVAPYMAVVLTILLGLTLYQATTTRSYATDLRDGLVTSCEENGNPLREAVQDQLRKQIADRRNLDFERFFPTVPPDELRKLLDEQTVEDRKTLRKIAPVNCEALFP